MAIYRKRGARWQVIGKEPLVTTRADGTPIQTWKQRSKNVPSEAMAKQLVARVEAAAALGERWQDRRRDAVTTVRTMALAYVRAAVDAGAPLPTQRFRSAMIGSFLDFLGARDERDPGADTPVSTLTLSLLELYANSLPGEGRKSQTRYRKVMEAERMWAWGFERPERFRGVPQPRRYTGGSADADKLSPPSPGLATRRYLPREVGRARKG